MSIASGLERGTPVDRVFLHDFLTSHAGDVRGSVLEVADSRLTDRFGSARVGERHVLDIDEGNPNATLVADLAEPGSLPPGWFDCFILVFTLQYVSDLDAAVRNAWQALAPGGVLLIAVPTVGQLDSALIDRDAWRLTPAGLQTLLTRCCPAAEMEVKGFGNVLACVAALYGLAAEELDAARLRRLDPRFPVLACARVRRPPSARAA